MLGQRDIDDNLPVGFHVNWHLLEPQSKGNRLTSETKIGCMETPLPKILSSQLSLLAPSKGFGLSSLCLYFEASKGFEAKSLGVATFGDPPSAAPFAAG